MKYKVGDKFLMEIEVGRIDLSSVTPYKMLPDGGGWSEAALDDLRRPDDMTAEEAWEIAKKIVVAISHGGYSGEELKKIFGVGNYAKVMRSNTPQEAKAKIKAWEAAHFNDGDEVVMENGTKGLVVRTDKVNEKNPYVYILWKDGSCGGTRLDGLRKTGRHIDIQGMLEQIGGAEC